ncbi:hypothetical protein BYT27DRAFT_7199686 [Phlegmacium glaucopus]|nr:hypothetical protein BYT27DRAFT_7199686 [Phlegmacium glaucopus]
MATLTRPRSPSRPATSPLLNSQIPKPFPMDQLYQESYQDQQPTSSYSDDMSPPENAQVTSSINSTSEGPNTNTAILTDVLPSIVHVQKSCLMTLNDMLFGPVGLNSILPERRHSMPPATRASTSSITEPSTRLALQTLLTNFRNYEAQGEMIETRESATSSDLLRELHIRVTTISQSMTSSDAALANALVSLLLNLNRLSDLQTSPTQISNQAFNQGSSNLVDASPATDVFDALTRQLSDLQIERLSTPAGLFTPGTSPLVVVETALLWSRIDSELENVVSMCKQRTESLPQFMQDHLPPEYDIAVYDSEKPPDYEASGLTSIDDTKSKAGHSPQAMTVRSVEEKMRLDLEAVAVAIDRLYLVAPQLHNQRVELKSSKLAEMEKARREGMTTISQQDSRTKGKERDIRELENILDLLGKASERTLRDQSVVLDGGGMQRRVHQKEVAKQRAFVEQLVRHSEAGRIHGQDAVLQEKVKDPEALLTLPEFMREPPPESERQKDSNALLTLPEFVKEPIPAHIFHSYSEKEKGKSSDTKSKRDRSLSAPPLAWFRSTSSRGTASTSSPGSCSSLKGKSKHSQTNGFEVVYVAENHENLHHILVFFTITGVKPGAELQAEVLPLLLDQSSEQGDHLVIKCGPHTSLPLLLPAYTTSGKKEVRAQSTHYEIKLATTGSNSPFSDINGQPAPLLDATQLSSINPTSFLCSSCTLPLIQSSKVGTYRDLPSEHWEELVEAWMCHGDQKLHDHVTEHGKRGFWPSPGQALVGGSYILFEESAMNRNNFHMEEEPAFEDNWRLSRCLCGAVIGRCQERPVDGGKTTIYRVLKYAVRLVSQAAESLQIPLSAFVVEDMIEFVQAHASYRFVIRDEEDEKPRILIWLFKPKMSLAYTTPTSRAMSTSASVLAAKVLYKLLVPTDSPTDIKSILNKYPGFPQAEFLSYPMSVCRRLAGILNQSNSAYPQSMRTMTGLEVGWLQRV